MSEKGGSVADRKGFTSVCPCARGSGIGAVCVFVCGRRGDSLDVCLMGGGGSGICVPEGCV